MQLRKVLLGLAVGGLVLPVQASAEPLTMEPKSPWVLDYAEDSCALRRTFQHEGRETELEMRSFGPGEDMQFIVISKDFDVPRGNYAVQLLPIQSEPQPIEGTFNLNYGNGVEGRMFAFDMTRSIPEYQTRYEEFVRSTPALHDEQRELINEGLRLREEVLTAKGPSARKAIRAYSEHSMSDQYQAAIRRANRAFRQTDTARSVLSAQAEAITGLVLAGAFEEPLLLQTGSLSQVFSAMDDCLDELMAHWGIDVEAHRTLVQTVEPYDYDRLVSEMVEDYPRNMLRQGIPAFLRVRLDVSAQGEPTGCHMQSGLSDEAFEEIACRNMMRFARFYPALDVNREPIASYYQVSIVYRIN